MKQKMKQKWIDFRVSHKKLHTLLIRVEVIWWALLGRPIIYKTVLIAPLSLSSTNRNVLIAENSIHQKETMNAKEFERLSIGTPEQRKRITKLGKRLAAK